tara:strand:+ start:2818 stop:3075 length:258 start_codon:yes stop_codon:yes gene_type:complete
MDSAKLIDMIANDSSSSEVSDAIKDMLYNRSAGLVDKVTPDIAADLFGDEVPDEGDPLPEVGDGVEPVDAVEQEPEQETNELPTT